ncbi:lipid A deacylase LpxR family protein [Pedobacter sp. BS3]|uniref:lipid A deacylase LpxR family protein n=1 Tax=Pedobacter sp. BS3 TaxID=2567937 RepID=UPI0011ED0595|nr:lipid A deacylase LpxR family protein [Pedobacter sp. BS3]TZF82548.1 lipid A deacylase LpxR family protein [Pedobacter sp. BS3]
MINTLKKYALRLLATGAFLLTAFPLSAQYKNEFGFRSDNDSYLAQGQDRYYTNGLFIYFRHVLKTDTLGKLAKRTGQIEAGQKMYNPESGYVTDISQVDRPFAGYLYAGGSISWFFKSEQVIQASLQLGMIGPAALGEEAQKLMHRTFGFYQLNGWQYQVKNEFGVNPSVSYLRLLGRTANRTADITLNTYANAGTTFSGTGAGLLLRLGDSNPLFNSASTNSRITQDNSTKVANEFFFYAQPMLHVVAYDATLSGGLFRSDKGPVTYSAKPLVFSQQIGATYSSRRWTLDLSFIFKTKEIKSPAKPHQYGSIQAFYRFN